MKPIKNTGIKCARTFLSVRPNTLRQIKLKLTRKKPENRHSGNYLPKITIKQPLRQVWLHAALFKISYQIRNYGFSSAAIAFAAVAPLPAAVEIVGETPPITSPMAYT